MVLLEREQAVRILLLVGEVVIDGLAHLEEIVLERRLARLLLRVSNIGNGHSGQDADDGDDHDQLDQREATALRTMNDER